VTEAEELVRSTTRAIASTVRDVPPLRLEQAPEELRSPARRRARWRLGFAPAAAAVAIVLLAVGLVFVKHAQNATTISSATPGTSSASPGHVVVPDGIPEYYAWIQAGGSAVSVGNSVTGTTLVTFERPSGVVSLDAVYGTTDDDRTFVVTGDRAPGAGGGTQWYLLRITPGGTPAAQMTPLPISVRLAPAGVAISPDGTELAVAYSGTPAILRIYSIATGALLHSWTAPRGRFEAVQAQPGSVPDTSMTLRWTPDGQHVAYAWNGTAIRIIGAATPNGNLSVSATMAVIGTGYTPEGSSVSCNAAHGWNMILGAQGWAVACAGTWQAATPPGQTSAALCRNSHTVTFGIDVQSAYQGNGSENLQLAQQPQATECSSQVKPGDGVSIAWMNADDTVIGSLVQRGQARFGIFTGGNPPGSSFTALPSPPASSSTAW
jgi:hypothetical protein